MFEAEARFQAEFDQTVFATTFTAGGARRRYCSVACRDAARYARRWPHRQEVAQ